MGWQAEICKADPDAVVAALGRVGVAVVPDTPMDDAAFTAFLRRFGTLTFTAGEAPVPGHPDLNIVSNVGRTTPPRSVFHTDTSYVAAPPALTALKAEAIPEAGGETVFASLFLAHDRLPPTERHRLAGARVLHRVTGVDPGAGGETEAWHPLFRRHPVSGKTALFLSTPERCVDLRLADGTASPETIVALYEHAIDPAHVWRHRWRPGDILIWDNRATLHKGDHTAVRGDRVLHRGMVAGEVPLAA